MHQKDAMHYYPSDDALCVHFVLPMEQVWPAKIYLVVSQSKKSYFF